MKNIFKQKGFTLIELVIVVAVLSILSVGSIAILDPVSQFQKANDARRKSDLAQIQRGLEVYYDDNGKYPPNYSAMDYRIKALDGSAVIWGGAWRPYMDVVPKDPSRKKYVYYSSADGQSYYLYASLDKGDDPAVCNEGSACTSLSSNGIDESACGGTCNFAVSSPNVNP